jgi:hypothetical protein
VNRIKVIQSHHVKVIKNKRRKTFMKRRIFSRTLSALLVAVMVVAMIPFVALPASASTVDNEFIGANVALGSDITVNYYATAEKTPTAKFTMNGKETTVTGVATGEPDEYVFAFTGVAPQCMGDNISAELIVDGTTVDVVDEYSVLANVTSPTVMNDENRQLIYDLLAYGAAAQQYANYKTDALVNDGYEDLATPYAPIENNDRNVGAANVDGAFFSAAGVYHSNANKIYAKVTVENSVEGLSVKIKNVLLGCLEGAGESNP